MEIASLIISILSFVFASFIAFRQLKYTRNQDKLNALLKEKEVRELDSLNEADFCANLIDLGKSSRIRVSNIGKCIATDVNVSFPNGNDWSVFTDQFPMAALHPQQKVDLIVARSLGSPIKQLFQFTWNDKKGNHEKLIELTCP